MNKKAFTLIELIATIVIIAILALVATVSISNIIKKTNDRAYKEIELAMKTAAQNYMLKGNDIGVTTSETLINGGFLEKPIDPKTKKPCSVKKSYVNITKEEVSGTINDKYNYNVCLICGDYQSEYCKDKLNIELSYRDIDDDKNTYTKLNNESTIDMKNLLGIKVKYETTFEVSGNINYEIIDENQNGNCADTFVLEKLKNNYFAIFKTSNIEASCKVKVWDDSDESALKPSYFTINNKTNDNYNASDSLELYTGNNYYIETSEKIHTSNIINFEKKLVAKRFKFRFVDDEKKIIMEETEGLKYELINNISSSKHKCFELTGSSIYTDEAINGNINHYKDELNNSSIVIEHINDGCENVKLRVSDKDGNRIKDYLLEFLDLKHINYLTIGKKFIEVSGTYASSVKESFSSQKITFEPVDSDFATSIKCGCLIKKGDTETITSCAGQPASCSVISKGNDKYLLVTGGNRPTVGGETVPMVLYVDDENSKVEPIKLNVKVKNVLPEDFGISYSTNRDSEILPHMCNGNQNYIKVNLTPANAFGYISGVSFNPPDKVRAGYSIENDLFINVGISGVSGISILSCNITIANEDMKNRIKKMNLINLYPDNHVAGSVTTGCNGQPVDNRRFYCQ